MPPGNNSTVTIELEVDGKGGVKVVRTMKKEFDDLGKKGKRSMDSLGNTTGMLRRGFTTLLPSVTSFAAIFTSGALLRGATEVGEAFEQAYFQMSYTFQERTNEMIATAERMAERFRYFYDVVDISYAFTKTADSMERYGITGQNYIDLVARAADVGAAKNLELKESIDRIESAMRGEAEASEYLGLTLNDTYMKNIAFGGSLKDTWEKLSDLEKAQYRFQELMEQSQKYTGAATKATDNLSGASKRFWNTLKNELSPALRETNRGLAEFVNRITDTMKTDAFREIEKQIEHLQGLQRIAERSSNLWGGGEEKIQRIADAIEVLREKIKLMRGPVDDLSADWGGLNKNIDNDKIDLTAKEIAELTRQLEALDKAVSDSNANSWDPGGFDLDAGGFSDLTIAIQKAELAENNRQIALARSIEMQNQLADAMDDTYDIDFGSHTDSQYEDFEVHSSRMLRLSQRTADAMEDNFSDFFFDALTGEMDDLGDYWDRFMQSLYQATADWMGQIAKELIFGNGDQGGANWLGLITNIVGLFSGGAGSSGPSHVSSGGTTAYGMSDGGYLGETVRGIGMQTGSSYELHADEYVLPPHKIQATAGNQAMVVNVNLNVNAIDPQTGLQFVKSHMRTIGNDVMEQMRFHPGARGLLREAVD